MVEAFNLNALSISSKDNGPLLICPQNFRLSTASQSIENFLMGMAKAIIVATGNNRPARIYGCQKFLTAGGATAMNMYVLGVDPKLDFSNIHELVELYEKVTRMHVHERQPYAGALVFAAFSGSHQDAIAKGMKWREEQDPDHWTVPYLPIDPHDVGREYEADVIRINSQSGKGGVAYIMEQKYGISMPKKMREDFGYCVKDVSDHKHKELLGDEIYQIFHDNYVNVSTPYNLIDFSLKKEVDGTRSGYVELEINGKPTVFKAKGNGRLDAISNAIQENTDVRYTDLTYSEHALEIGSTSRAMAYIGVTGTDGKITWGAGMDTDIITASVMALFSAINRMVKK